MTLKGKLHFSASVVAVTVKPCIVIVMLILQTNLDYSKFQGPQESFRIIGSSNDRKREFSDIFGKARMLSKNVIVLPEFATSTHVFREVIGTSAKALKKMSSLEVVASSSLMLCRSKNAENFKKRHIACRPLVARRCVLFGLYFSFISAKTYDLGV